jgi:ubiquitin carboxyl-terminal hydrolase 10
MCSAKSVLQIMAYCPPFHRLFAELGRVLGGVGLSGVAGTSGNGTAAEASTYPLLEATVEFFREFVIGRRT